VRLALLTALTTLLLAAPAPALELGLFDDPAFNDDRAKQRRLALKRADDARAAYVRFTLDWALVAPQERGDGFEPGNPFDRRYSWGYVEDFVRDARRRGLRVILTVVGAPSWGRDEGGPVPRHFRQFVSAAAQRFSGFFPDPKLDGRELPRVRFWQIWDEPNGTRRPVSAERYRALLAAGRQAVKDVDTGSTVLTAGTAAGPDAAPLAWWRDMLCLTPSLERAAACGVRFDAAAHHPVAANASPLERAGSDDVGVRDLGRLDRVLEAARGEGTLGGDTRKPVWVTRLGWTTPPVDSDGVSRGRQRAHLLRALHILRRRPVVIWDGLRDTERGRGERFPPVASGLWARRTYRDLRRDRPKPALAAFRFPLAATRRGSGTDIWGLAPKSARTVQIQRLRRGKWQTLRRVRPHGRAFSARVRHRTGTFRARSGRATSVRARPRS
jgi:hypothetical protein